MFNSGDINLKLLHSTWKVLFSDGKMKTFGSIAVIVAVVAVLYACGSLSTALIIITSLISAVLGIIAGLSMVLCSGKMEKASRPEVQPMVATLLLTKMMVRNFCTWKNSNYLVRDIHILYSVIK